MGNEYLPPGIPPRPGNLMNYYFLKAKVGHYQSNDINDYNPTLVTTNVSRDVAMSQYEWDSLYILPRSVVRDIPNKLWKQPLELKDQRIQDFSSLYYPICGTKEEYDNQFIINDKDGKGNDGLPSSVPPRPGNRINYYALPSIALTDDNSYNHLPIRRTSETDDKILWDQYYWDQKYILPKSIVFAGSTDVYEELVKDQRIGDYSYLYDPILYISDSGDRRRR